ncbi:hypothetical protein NEOLEDRAFT_1141014 [Neolentinus lepideus HHB14362 ss-1]|uniref:Uncharacterized protein n=1 Tax=Neolentinus lepideus HHB14362 ss-1 TaxID=1314782 RepID=A0A165NYL7_9AGAM|nr:hypothetical protein NEOLEDRAFT_1141014 [Neolentinus lepideus HHB14362 ss-1]
MFIELKDKCSALLQHFSKDSRRSVLKETRLDQLFINLLFRCSGSKGHGRRDLVLHGLHEEDRPSLRKDHSCGRGPKGWELTKATGIVSSSVTGTLGMVWHTCVMCGLATGYDCGRRSLGRGSTMLWVDRSFVGSCNRVHTPSTARKGFGRRG